MNLFDPKLPVETRNGLPARIIASGVKNSIYLIAAVITGKDGEESVQTYTAEGHYSGNQNSVSELDLVNVPAKVQVSAWVNVYRPGTPAVFHPTRALADMQASPGRFACIEISATAAEGQGL